MSIYKRVVTTMIVLFAALCLVPAAANALTLYAEFEDGSHDCLTLEVESGDSIDRVKDIIGSKTDEVPEQMALCYNGRTLYTGRTLNDYNIQKGSTVTVKRAVPVAIDEAHFPDAMFREFVAGYDTNKDGTSRDGALSAEEIVDATEMDCQQHQIGDLTGIEYFTALRSLECSYNSLTSLDLSKNAALKSLQCSTNQLTLLDVSNNTNLEELCVDRNPLSALDVSKNAKLVELSCMRCGLTSLDVSNNSELAWLNCQSNSLSSLDVSKNTKLDSVYCSRNGMTSLSLGSNDALKKLYCGRNELTVLDVSNCSALEDMDCYKNQLPTLDVSHNTVLRWLYCDDNQLTSLDMSKNLELRELVCSNNQLITLDLGSNSELQHLVCNGNQFTSLDVSKNTKLEYLGCKDCSRLIGVDGDRSFDLAQLPGFDVAKASEWEGGKVVGTVLTVDGDAEAVTYGYDCGAEEPVTFTLAIGFAVSFDTAGGSKVETQTVAKDGAATKPSDPTKDKNVFAGWYADAACTQAYDFDTPVTKATTIYAKWTPVEDKGEDEDDKGDKGQDDQDKTPSEDDKGDKQEGGSDKDKIPDTDTNKKPDASGKPKKAQAIPQTGDSSLWAVGLLGATACLAICAGLRMRFRNN